MNTQKVYKGLLLVSMIFSLIQAGYCQQKADLRIIVADGLEINDSLSLTLWHHFTYLGSRYESENQYILPSHDDPYRLTVLEPNYSMRIRLVSSKVGLLIPFVPVEEEDNVLMQINKIYGEEVDIVFSGTGSAKYSFLHRFEKNKSSIKPLWQKLDQYTDPVELLDDISKITKESLDLLEQHSIELSDSANFILKADAIGYFDRMQLMLAATGYANSNGLRKRKFEKILTNLLSVESLMDSSERLSFSKEYVEYLYTKTKIRLVYQYKPRFTITDMRLKAPYSFSDLYQGLKNKYSGRLRDQLLSYLLVNSSEMARYFGGIDPLEFQQCQDDALLTMESPTMLRLIAHERRTVSVGEKAYDFELPDMDGKMVRLSDFEGKLVLIDFWGIGCSGCLEFKKRFEELIYPQVKDNPNFVFVSINIDKSRETWLKALPVYSNPDFINLGLHGMGNKHEVYKQYSIKSLPTVLLVDRRGKIVSSTLPRNMDDLMKQIGVIMAIK